MEGILGMTGSPKSPKEFQFPDPNSLSVTEQDVRQIEFFFLSLKSRVYVCPALANLYFTTLEDMANLGGWDLKTTGFPTLIFEKHNPDENIEGKLQLCIAEKGTGFVQWKDLLSDNSNYKVPGRTFHTFKSSEEEGRLIGLSFDDVEAADNFYETVQSWIGEDYTLKNIANNNRKVKPKKRKQTAKARLLRKETISMPCRFEHVTKLDHEAFLERANRQQMPAFIPASPDIPAPAPPVARLNHSPRSDVERTHVYADENGSQYAGSVICPSESTSNEDSGLDEI